eukprot:m.99382 g.99382  ORF g.99382 m.99382 type:complete len:1726 (+) comp10307_c0_seq1:211-5388(+)
MSNMRYETIGRDTHRHGRISCLIDVDKKQKKLFVHLIEARGIGNWIEPIENEGAEFYVRTMLLPSKNPMLVQEALFSDEHPENDKYTVSSEIHAMAPNPYFGEEYVIDLSEIWKMLPDYRIHFALWASVEACSDGSGFMGCTSFGFDDIIAMASNKDATGERSRWWWLFTKDAGIYRNKAVEQMAVSSDPSRVGSDVEVSGRSPTDTNADINGYYTWQSDLWNGRATYKQKRPVGQPKYMYYISARQVWAIGEYAGSLAPIAYCPSTSLSADNIKPEGGLGKWSVYTKEASQEPPPDRGAQESDYEVDPTAQCTKVADGVELPAEFSLKRGSSFSIPSSDRATQAMRVITSVDEFSQRLGILEVTFKKAIEIHPDNGGVGLRKAMQLFSNVEEIAMANAAFLNDLLQIREVDPAFDRPMGPMLQQSLSAMFDPFARYCQDLPFRVAEFRRLMMEPDGALFRAALESPAGGVRLDPVAVATAMEAPFLQIQRYPHYINALWRSSQHDSRKSVGRDVAPLGDALRLASKMCDDIQNVIHNLAADRYAFDEQRRLAEAQIAEGNSFEAILERGPDGYGIVIERSAYGIFITQVDDNALMSHPLPAGTRFLALNGESIEHATMQEIASIFATTSQLLTVVSYAPKQFLLGRALKSVDGFHRTLSIAEANMKLRAFRGGNGSYLLRIPEELPDQLAMAVMYNDKPTHHILDLNASGHVCVNGRDYDKTPDLSVFLQTLRRAHAGWPVPLTMAVPFDKTSKSVVTVEVPHVDGSYGLAMGGAKDTHDIEKYGAGIFLSNVIPGSSGDEVASKYIGWQIVEANGTDISQGCITIDLKDVLLKAAGEPLVLGLQENPDLLVKYAKDTRNSVSGISPTEFAKGLAAAFVRAHPDDKPVTQDTVCDVDVLRQRMESVAISALLTANETLGRFVRPGADLTNSLGATVANAAKGNDDISLATFVQAFGGDVSLLQLPKTLTLPEDSDDDDDDTWAEAKPAAANDVIDHFNDMKRYELIKLCKEDNIEVTPETTSDEMRRQLRAADAARAEEAARVQAEQEEAARRKEKKRALSLVKVLCELFIATEGTSYDDASVDMELSRDVLAATVFKSGIAKVLTKTGRLDEYSKDALGAIDVDATFAAYEMVPLPVFVDTFGGDGTLVTDVLANEDAKAKNKIAFFHAEAERERNVQATAATKIQATYRGMQARKSEHEAVNVDQYSKLSQRELLAMMRSRGVSAEGCKDTNALREKLRDNDKPPVVVEPEPEPEPEPDHAPEEEAPVAVAEDSRQTADDYETMGRLACIKLLRKRSVDYSECPNVEALRDRLRESDPPSNEAAQEDEHESEQGHDESNQEPQSEPEVMVMSSGNNNHEDDHSSEHRSEHDAQQESEHEDPQHGQPEEEEEEEEAGLGVFGTAEGDVEADEEESLPPGWVEVEIDREEDEKWGLTIKPLDGGGLMIKRDPSPGTAAARHDEVKAGWILARINDITCTTWGRGELGPILGPTTHVKLVLMPPPAVTNNDDAATNNEFAKEAEEAAPANVDDEYTTMKRLQLIKVLRKRKVDYANKDVDELRELARATHEGSTHADAPDSPPAVSRRESKRMSRRDSKKQKKEANALAKKLASLTPHQQELFLGEVNWYKEIWQDDAIAMVENQPVGTFIVRHSLKGDTGLSLTAVQSDGAVKHWPINTQDGGTTVGLNGCDTTCPTTIALMEHYTTSDDNDIGVKLVEMDAPQ